MFRDKQTPSTEVSVALDPLHVASVSPRFVRAFLLQTSAFHVVSEPSNIGLANDLAQDSFIKAFQALKSFRGGSSFYTWL
jgi:DNA-directed RNA polymerase specialized sigma24 family protein